MPESQRRKFFRISYTSADAPHFNCDGVKFEVIDLSEKGMLFKLGMNPVLKTDTELTGTLYFTDEETFLIRGMVRRVQDGKVSLEFKLPLALRKIMSEQRRLIQKYPRAKS